MSESSGEVEQLLDVLTNAPDTAARVDGLNSLTALIERSHGAEAEALGAVLRSTGAVGQICTLVDDAAPSVHLRAMSILGNLVADVFDPRAVESVALASKAGVLPRLLARLGDASFPAKLYAAACLQNMTSVDGDVCGFLNGQGAAKQLEAMLRQPGLEEEVCSRTPRCCPYPPPTHPPRTHPALTCAVCAALCVQLMQFVSGTLANMLGRGAAELEEEGATRASLAAAAQQRREQDAAAAEASRRAGAEALRVEHASKVVQRAVRAHAAPAHVDAEQAAQDAVLPPCAPPAAAAASPPPRRAAAAPSSRSTAAASPRGRARAPAARAPAATARVASAGSAATGLSARPGHSRAVQGGHGGQRVRGIAVSGGGVVAAPRECDDVAKLSPPEGRDAHAENRVAVAAMAAVADAVAAHRHPAAGPGDTAKAGDPALLRCPFYRLALATCFDDEPRAVG